MDKQELEITIKLLCPIDSNNADKTANTIIEIVRNFAKLNDNKVKLTAIQKIEPIEDTNRKEQWQEPVAGTQCPAGGFHIRTQAINHQDKMKCAKCDVLEENW